MDNHLSRIRITSLLVFAIILFSSFSYALSFGITPGRTTVDFKPGAEGSVGFSVVNPDMSESQLVVYVQGELNESIFLAENSLTINNGEGEKRMSYDYKLPETLSPGVHQATINVLQLPKKTSTNQVVTGAAIVVTTQFIVQVPYPGKYAEADMSISNADQGGESTFVIPIFSKGNTDLVDVRANVDIYNKLNEKVASFNTDSIGVQSGQRGEIVHRWKADVPVGVYRAVATVIYDEGTLMLERQFNVGRAELDLQQVSVKDFALGDIAKFEMLVENKWSEPIKSAYSQTQVFDKDGKVMADFKSPTYDFEPLSKTLMVSYWDTGGVKVGTYDASIALKYGDKSLGKSVQFKVLDDSIEVIGLGYVISESGSRGSGSGGNSNLVIILVVAVVVLVLLNAVWFLMLRKKLFSKSASAV